MSLFVHFKHHTHKDTRQKQWHVGKALSPMHASFLKTEEGWEVFKAEASGEEKDFIFENFSNVPMRANRDLVTWHGDFAKFIAENLLYLILGDANHAHYLLRLACNLFGFLRQVTFLCPGFIPGLFRFIIFLGKHIANSKIALAVTPF
jgi:hypothetical protein